MGQRPPHLRFTADGNADRTRDCEVSSLWVKTTHFCKTSVSRVTVMAVLSSLSVGRGYKIKTKQRKTENGGIMKKEKICLNAVMKFDEKKTKDYSHCSAVIHFVKIDGTRYSVMSVFDIKDTQSAKDRLKYLVGKFAECYQFRDRLLTRYRV